MNPYHFGDEPTLVSFSGGRTSGYMLKQIIDAYDGTLPPHVAVTFFNTGKERPETLDFVHQCGLRWGAPIYWLEYDPTCDFNTRITNYGEAARKGEPYEALIRKRRQLPNVVTRFCTSEMKVRRGEMFMFRVMGYRHWLNAVGLRADEPRRTAKMDKRNEARKARFIARAPLRDAGVTLEQINGWWAQQPFNLQLQTIDGKTLAGNCDLCFLKGRAKLEALIQANPEWADWWIGQEAAVKGLLDSEGRSHRIHTAAQFSMRHSYTDLRNSALEGVAGSPGDEGDDDCNCTD